MWIEIGRLEKYPLSDVVTSYAEVWIEIMLPDQTGGNYIVTSYAEVWIEIQEIELRHSGR